MAKHKSGVAFRSAGYDAATESGDVANTPIPGPVSIHIYEAAGTGSITSYTMQVFGSLDGTNYTQIGSDVSAATILGISDPIDYYRVTMSAKVMTGDAAIWAKITRVWD